MCLHWWLIEMPEGPLAPGVCKYCGEEREIETAAPRVSFWEEGEPDGRARGPRSVPVATKSSGADGDPRIPGDTPEEDQGQLTGPKTERFFEGPEMRRFHGAG